ncbi:Hsp20/alpha crystallin family protein [Metabacillus malikii]|uniref:HSP20 family protein n=1 Tax=Metabacillus malikii TaxID=1504265 RepID=A0ABT9Z975_9BACI|nr:Hsp20/alpha crystallin family protein [Metabacillus malikii]MDQ0228803.1 HSP20 family protein [Metabacillus malikii]
MSKKDKHIDSKSNHANQPIDFFQIVDQFFRSEPLKQFMNDIDHFVLDSFPERQIHVNTYETDLNYHIDLKFPPVKKEQLSLELFNEYLTISISNHEEYKEYNENSSTFRSFTSHDSITRTIILPYAVKENEMKTSFKEGTLLITIPKKSKQIKIEEG